ncbi:DUF397 domain-containing protein [Saccharopolyspora hattusasensis]|uniref:DUF397 domain-containing protein n=1 Tax=Saccharopolyspora hattusasensis TaxID=1128679 RepID=UPI003D99C52A
MQRSTPTLRARQLGAELRRSRAATGLGVSQVAKRLGLARPKSPSAPDWRKSSRRGNTNCVEVALDPKGAAIRDSKGPTGPVLVVSAAAFGEFVAGLRSRRLLARG